MVFSINDKIVVTSLLVKEDYVAFDYMVFSFLSNAFVYSLVLMEGR